MRIVAAIFMTLALAASVVRADDKMESARKIVDAADIDYKLGKFTEALAGYAKAYEIYPAPPLLFNIGQCHRNLKHYERAIFFFEGYLRDSPQATNRRLVEDLLRESRAELAKEKAAKEREAAALPPKHAEPEPKPDPKPEPRRATPSRSQLLPWALVGGGAVLAGSGGVFYYYGSKRGAGEKFVYDDTRILGGTLLVLGAASVATGVVLLVREPGRPLPVTAITPTSVYLGWAGSF